MALNCLRLTSRQRENAWSRCWQLKSVLGVTTYWQPREKNYTRNRGHCQPRGDMRDAKGKNYICSEEGEHRQSNTRRLPAVEAGNRDDSLAVRTVPTVLSLQQWILREKVYISHNSDKSTSISESTYGSDSKFALISSLRYTKQEVAAMSKHFSLGSYFNW